MKTIRVQTGFFLCSFDGEGGSTRRNILMNIGPMGTGKFSAPDLDILKQIAAWWKVNGEASIRERRLLR